MKVIKNYGVVAEHGNKELRLQTILDANKEKRLALVSYKDGMSFKTTDITEEAKELKRLLEDYLGYKKESEDDKAVCTLIGLPATDINYQSALSSANEKVLSKAIKLMEKNGGNNKTRIKACQNALKKLDNKNNKTVAFPTNKESSAPTKKYEYADANKKSTIIPLKTDGNHIYEECVTKLDTEANTFIDSNCAYVINGLKELCKVDQDFRNNLMREDKTFGGFIEYMCKIASNGYVITYGHCSWIDIDLSLELAIDYYNADFEKMEAKEKEEAEKRKAEADKKKKEAKSNGKKSTKKK